MKTPLSVILMLLLIVAASARELPEAGSTGYGLTVFQGTKVEKFGITVLGKSPGHLRGEDMLLIRIDDGPLPAWRTGVLAGMSGSPIYVDGELIGALSYGYLGAQAPIAGVTPIDRMLEMLPEIGGGEKLSSTTSAPTRKLSQPITLGEQTYTHLSIDPQDAVSAHTLPLQPLSSSVVVHGFDQAALDLIAPSLSGVQPLVPVGELGQAEMSPILSTGSMVPTLPSFDGELDTTLKPGSAFSVELMRGDFRAFATGTVTWAEGTRILGLGHAFTELGDVAFPLSPAFVATIHPSYLSARKMGFPLDPQGTIEQDRYYGVAGSLGSPATLRPFEIEAGDRTFRIDIVDHPKLAPVLLAGAVSAAGSRMVERGGTYRLVLSGELRFAETSHAVPVELAANGTDAPSLLANELSKRLRKVSDPERQIAHLTGGELSIKVEPAQVVHVIGLQTDKSDYSSGETATVEVLLETEERKTETISVSYRLPDVRSKKSVTLEVDASKSAADGFGVLDTKKPRPSSLSERLHQLLSVDSLDDHLYIYAEQGSSHSAPLLAGWPMYGAPSVWSKALPGVERTKDYWLRRVQLQGTVRGKASTKIEVHPNKKPKDEALVKGYVSDPKPRPTLASLGPGAYRWQLFDDADWENGVPEGVLIERGLTPGPSLQQVDRVPGQIVTSVLSASGKLYSGWTGGEVRVHESSGARTYLQTDCGAVTAMTEHGGRLTLGLSGPGAVHTGTTMKRLPARYVWGLGAYGSQLYAACGSPAQLVKLSAREEVVWTAPDEHIIRLEETAEGLLLTTAPLGLTYRFSGSEPQLIKSNEQPPVRAGKVAKDDYDSAPSAVEPLLCWTNDWAGGADGLFTRREGGLAMVSRQPITSITSHQGHTYLGSDALYRLAPAVGRYTSPVLNTEALSRFSNLRWTGSPAAKIRVRGGQSPFPDSSWQVWSEPMTNPLGSALKLKDCQYFQFQVELPEGRLESVEVSFLAPAPVDGTVTFDSLAGKRFRDVLEVEWTGQSHSASSRLFYGGQDSWTEVKEPFEPGYLVLPTSSLPEGPLRLRLVSGGKETISSQFYILKEPLKLELTSTNRGTVSTSKYGQIVKVEYKVGDDGSWTSARPLDGAFDSSSEQFLVGGVSTDKLQVRAYDESGTEVKEKREPPKEEKSPSP